METLMLISLVLQLDDDKSNGLKCSWIILRKTKAYRFYLPALGEDPERRPKANTTPPPINNPSTPISTVTQMGNPDDDEEPEDMLPEDDAGELDIDVIPTMPLHIGLMFTRNRKLPAS